MKPQFNQSIKDINLIMNEKLFDINSFQIYIFNNNGKISLNFNI